MKMRFRQLNNKLKFGAELAFSYPAFYLWYR